MNVSVMNASKYYFTNRVAYYFGYAYLAMKKLLVSLQSSF